MSAHPQALPAPASANPADLAGVWRGDQLARPLRRTLSTGFAALDAELPGGGWPVGALVDLLLPAPGVGEVAMLAPLMAQASRQGPGVWWIAPPLQPCAPALQQAGLDLARLTIVTPTTEADAWWAAEQALRSGACALVLLWCHPPARTPGPRIPRPQALRRLHLAAQGTAASVIALHSGPAAQPGQPSPAPLRLACRPLPGRALAVEILKRQGPACTQVLRIALPDPLAMPPASVVSAVSTPQPASPAPGPGTPPPPAFQPAGELEAQPLPSPW